MKILKLLWPLIPISLGAVFVGLFFGYFSAAFRFTPPSTPGDFAAWAGAIGSIGAIVGAGMGIYVQLRHTTQLAEKNAAISKSNVVFALLAELKVYQVALGDIDDKISTDPSSIFSEMLQMTFPSSSFRFPVYLANAAQIWAITDVDLREKIIGLYAEMDMLFSLIDRNSEAARRIPDGEVPPPEVKAELKKLHPLIKKLAAKLLKSVTAVRIGLRSQVSALDPM